MTTTQQITKKALWIPGWYELDQPLTVNSHERLWFYQQAPADLPDVESFDFVFFNQLSTAANCQVRTASVLSIEHSTLGPLRQIETDGLDYIFHPWDAEGIVVNAEEEPGTCHGGQYEITDWSVTVLLSDVSEPVMDYCT